MPRFNFRLQQYLGVKEQIENQKELEYAQALRKVEEEKLLLSQINAKKSEQLESLRTALKTIIAPLEIRRYNNTIDRLKQRIKEQEERLTAAQEYAETKRQELVQAMKERKALDVVREHAFDDYKIEMNLKEQKQVDELVSAKYVRKGTKKE